jgi:diadenosine tetraphosphate (Ap4A) HIT family hydrolase
MRLPPHFGMDDFPDQELVLQNDHCVFLTTPGRTILPGSGLIVPFEPRATVFDLTAAELVATFELLRLAKSWIDERYAADGYNVGWNNGPVAGQTIFQAHLHVIPRFADEPLAGKGIRHHLKQPHNIRPGLANG